MAFVSQETDAGSQNETAYSGGRAVATALVVLSFFGIPATFYFYGLGASAAASILGFLVSILARSIACAIFDIADEAKRISAR